MSLATSYGALRIELHVHSGRFHRSLQVQNALHRLSKDLLFGRQPARCLNRSLLSTLIFRTLLRALACSELARCKFT